MLTNGSAVPCRNKTGQVMRSSPAGTSTIDAYTVSRYPGASAKSNSSWRASAAGSCQGRLRSMAKNRDRPAPVGATWLAWGCEERGQGSSAHQGRRLVDPLKRRAQPVGGDRDN